MARRHREALDELELFELQTLHHESLLTDLYISSLPSFPYRDNAVLHIYAGICTVFTSQSGTTSELDVGSIDSEMLDRALIFFERAKSLDPENVVVDSLLCMVRIKFSRRAMAEHTLWEDPKSTPVPKGSPAGRSFR